MHTELYFRIFYVILHIRVYTAVSINIIKEQVEIGLQLTLMIRYFIVEKLKDEHHLNLFLLRTDVSHFILGQITDVI